MRKLTHGIHFYLSYSSIVEALIEVNKLLEFKNIMPKTDLDMFDRRILAALMKDANLSNVDLADKWDCHRPLAYVASKLWKKPALSLGAGL